MAKFVLTAQLQLQAPTNVRNVVNTINNQLKGLNANINVSVNNQSIQQLAKVNKAIKNTSRQTKNASKDLQSFGKDAALAIRRFGAFITATFAFRRFTNAVSTGITEAIKFERELVKIAQVTDTSVRSLKGLTTEISKLSTKFGVSSASLVKVSRVLAQTGLETKKVQIALTALAKSDLAPTFNNIAQTAEAAIAIFRQFKIGAEDLESTLGSINAVAGKFAVEASDIAVAIRRTGGAFAAAGGNLKELIALFTSVRATTRESAESIATGFRTIFTRLQRARTITFLKGLGIELRNASGEFIGPFKAIKKLSEALQNLSTTDPRFAQITEELGGFRQVSKVIPLIKQFSQAQKALNVAQAGGSSLSRDAAKAQETLAVRIQKVREEFTLLLRKFANSSAFKTFADAALIVARSLVKIGEAVEPLLGLLSTLALPLAASGFSKFLGNPRGGGFIGSLRGFNQGGLVPGTGNSDTVPAMLSPGEFVLRKKAVQNIGLNNTKKFNKGGPVEMGNGGFTPTLTSRGRSQGDVGRRKQFRSQRIDFLRKGRDSGVLNQAELAELSNLEARQGAGNKSRTKRLGRRLGMGGGGAIRKFNDGGLVNESKVGAAVLQAQGRHKNFVGAEALNIKGKKLDVIRVGLHPSVADEFSGKLDQGIINAASATSRDLGGPGIAKGEGNRFLGTVNQAARGNLFEDVLRVVGGKGKFGSASSAGAPFDFTAGLGGVLADDFSRLSGIKYIDAKASFDKASRDSFLTKATNQLNKEGFKRGEAKGGAANATFAAASASDRQLAAEKLQRRTLKSDVSLQQRAFGVTNLKVSEMSKIIKGQGKATGGGISGTDSVSALLTPGEFVVNKKSASQIGVDNLNKLNDAKGFGRGGKIRKFAKGGFVKGFASGGSVGGGGGGVANATNLFILGAVVTQLTQSFIDTESGMGKFLSTMITAATQFIIFSGLLKGLSNNKTVKGINKNVPGTVQSGNRKLAKQRQAEGKKTLDLEKKRAPILAKQARLEKQKQVATARQASLNKELSPQFIAANKRQTQIDDVNSAQAGLTSERRRIRNQQFVPAEGTNPKDKRQQRKPLREFKARRTQELKDFNESNRGNQVAINKERSRLLGLQAGPRGIDLASQPNIRRDFDRNVKFGSQNDAVLREIDKEQTRNNAQLSRNTVGLNDSSLAKDNIRGKRRRFIGGKLLGAGRSVRGFAAKNATNIGAGLAVGGQIAGGLVTDGAFGARGVQERIDAGEDASTQAGVGGALSGAASGAAIGAIFGPWGIAIGGAVGALHGFISASNEASEALVRAKFNKSADELNKDIASVLSGESTLAIKKGRIGSNAKNVIGRIETSKTGEDRQELQGAIDKSVLGLSQLVEITGKTSSSVEEFSARIGPETLKSFATLSGTTVPILLKELGEEISKRTVLTKTLEDSIKEQRIFADRIKTLADLTSVFQDATFAVQGFSSVLTDLSSGGSKVGDTTSILSRPSQVTDATAFQGAVSRVQGILGDRGARAGADANVSQQVLSQLQPLLLQTRAEDPLGQGKDFIPRLLDRFDKQFGKGEDVQFARKIVEARLKAFLGPEEKTGKVLEGLDADPSKLTGSISKGFDGFVTPLVEAGKAFDEQLNRAITFAQARVAKELQITDATNKIVDIAQERANVFSRFNQSRTNVGQADAFDAQRLKNIAGGTGTPEQFGNQAIAAQQRALKLTQDLNKLDEKDARTRLGLIDARADEEKKVKQFTSALQFTADVTRRIAAPLARLGEIEKEKQQKFSFASDFTFGSNKQREGIGRNIQAATAVGAGGVDIDTIPENLRGGVRSTFRALSDVRLAAFGQIKDKDTGVLRNATGREAEQRTVEKSFLKLGINPKEAARAALNATTPEEEKLRNAITTAFEKAAKAQAALVKILESEQKAIVKAMVDSNDKFLTKLEQLFLQRDVNDAQGKVTTETSRVNLLEKRSGAKGRLDKAFNRDLKNEGDVAQLQGVLGRVKEFRVAKKNRQGVLSSRLGAEAGISTISKSETNKGVIREQLRQRAIASATRSGADKDTIAAIKTKFVDDANINSAVDKIASSGKSFNQTKEQVGTTEFNRQQQFAKDKRVEAGKLVNKAFDEDITRTKDAEKTARTNLDDTGAANLAFSSDEDIKKLEADIKLLTGVDLAGLSSALQSSKDSLIAFTASLDKLKNQQLNDKVSRIPSPADNVPLPASKADAEAQKLGFDSEAHRKIEQDRFRGSLGGNNTTATATAPPKSGKLILTPEQKAAAFQAASDISKRTPEGDKRLQDAAKRTGKANGGLIGGTGIGDSVPAMLTPGEFVMTKAATNSIGIGRLGAANRGVQYFQHGGSVRKFQDTGSNPHANFGAASNGRAFPPTQGDGAEKVMHDFSRADKLITALDSFPREVTHSFSGQVEVIFNGAEVMKNIMPEIQNLVNARIKDGINKLIQEKFPDAGPID